MIETIQSIKQFVVYYNSIVAEIEKVTPTKKTIETFYKGFNFYIEEDEFEDKEVDVVDDSKPLTKNPNIPSLQDYLENEKRFIGDCDTMILYNEDSLFRSILGLFKALKYYPSSLQFINKELFDEKMITDKILKLRSSVIANYEYYDTYFDAIEERRGFLQNIQKETIKHDAKVNNSKSINAIPKELDTDEARRLLPKAIEAGLIVSTESGYEWKGKSNALLAYFCGKIYCGDTLEKDTVTNENIVKKGSAFFPEMALCTMFGVKNLGQSRLQIQRPPRGYEEIDILFEAAD